MFGRIWLYALTVTVAAATIVFPASAQTSLDGQVIFASEPLVNATVTLWRASAGGPAQIAQGTTNGDGHFSLNAPVRW